MIAVNGWMNDPQGFTVVDGRVTDPEPWDALFNGHLAHELVHMYLAGYVVAGFIVAGVYARARLRGKRDAYHRTGLVVALSFAALATLCQGAVGDWAGRNVAENQPVKLAAFEGLPTTTEGAPFTIGGFYDAETNELNGGIEIPKLLSLLATHDPNGTVIGPRLGAGGRPAAGQHRALRVPRRWSASGTVLGALAAVLPASSGGAAGALPRSPWFYRAVIAAGPLALVALIAGWITTEVGRQPWIVYETMRTSDAVTALGRARGRLRRARRSSTSG